MAERKNIPHVDLEKLVESMTFAAVKQALDEKAGTKQAQESGNSEGGLLEKIRKSGGYLQFWCQDHEGATTTLPQAHGLANEDDDSSGSVYSALDSPTKDIESPSENRPRGGSVTADLPRSVSAPLMNIV